MSTKDLIDEYLLLDDLSFTDDHTLHGLSQRHNIKVIQSAIDAGYVSKRHDDVCRVTQSGHQRLRHLAEVLVSAEQHAQQLAAEDTKQKRATVSDRVFQLLLTLFSFFLGMLAEHFSGVLDFLKSILH